MQLGADVDALDQMARRFDQAASEIGNLITMLGGQVDSAWWQGADADRFRADWAGTHRPNLNNLCTQLQQVSQRVTRQAQQQRTTSQ